MTVTIDSLTITGNAWRLEYSSDASDPTFYRYRDGALVDTSKATTWEGRAENGETPVLEVLDTTAAQTAAYPGRMTIGWYSVSGAEHYRIEEYVSGAWTLRKRVWETGAGFYAWLSRWLEDVTTHQFRIKAVGTDGNVSTATSLSALMVRHPDPPQPIWSYDGDTRKLSVTIDGDTHETAALDAAPAGTERTYHFAVRKRNAYDLLSQNTAEHTLTVDDTGAEVGTYPSAPEGIQVDAAADGKARVQASYAYLADGDDAADTWLVCMTDDGTTPDPDTDSVDTYTMAKSDGLAVLDELTSAADDEDTIKVKVGVRASGTPDLDTWDSTVYSCTANTDGPSAPDPAGIHVDDGEQHQ